MGIAPFFSGLRKGAAPPVLTNLRTGRALASDVELAGTSERRRRGLLGRDSLAPSTALIIAPCSAIHTCFMRFAIDVVFVDRRGLVLKVVRDVRPWRIAGSLRAHAVIEMAAGSLLPRSVRAGDQLTLSTPGPHADPGQ